MADEDQTATDQPADESNKVQARVVAQFVRDLSFESPNVHRLIRGPGENPNLKLEVNVNAKGVEPNLYETIIDFKANATNAEGTIYDLEIVYGGLFQAENMPANALEPFLLVNCPAILFPFLRRLVADLTREGGFPPLFLDPIDFATLYINRKKQGTQSEIEPADGPPTLN